MTEELGHGYSTRNLKYMRKFYLFQKGQQNVAQLSWGHYTILLSLKDNDKISYYISECIKYNLNRTELREKIKNQKYERLPNKTKNKLIKNEENKIEDLIKNPIIIRY